MTKEEYNLKRKINSEIKLTVQREILDFIEEHKMNKYDILKKQNIYSKNVAIQILYTNTPKSAKYIKELSLSKLKLLLDFVKDLIND